MKATHFRFDSCDPKVFVPTCGVWGKRDRGWHLDPPTITNDPEKVTCRLCLRRMGKISFPMGAQAHRARSRGATSLMEYVEDALLRVELDADTTVGPGHMASLRARAAIAAVRYWDRRREQAHGS